MVTKSTVLFAGSTGRLGPKIVATLVEKGDVNVRATVRLAQSATPKEPSNDSNE